MGPSLVGFVNARIGGGLQLRAIGEAGTSMLLRMQGFDWKIYTASCPRQ
jgi:hypothetical protein